MNVPISVIFSTITFILGFVIREWILIHKKNKNIINQNAYIQWHFDNIIKELPNQINGLSILIKSIIKEEYRNWNIEPKLKPSIVLEKQEILHNLVIDRKKGKLNEKKLIYNKLVGTCYLLEILLEECSKEFNKQNERIFHYENLLEDRSVKLYQQIIKLESKDNLGEIELKIKKLYESYSSIKIKSRKSVYTKLVGPLENMLIDSNHLEAENYIAHTSMYYKDYLFYIKTLEQFANKISEYRDNLIKIHNDLNEYCEKYRNMKFKNNWIN